MDKTEALSSRELNVLSETFRLLGDPSRPRILLRGACLMPRVRHPRWMFYGITDRHVGDVVLTMFSHVREKIARNRELHALGETL